MPLTMPTHMDGFIDRPRPMRVGLMMSNSRYTLELFDGSTVGFWATQRGAEDELEYQQGQWDAKHFPQFAGLPADARTRAVVASLTLLKAAS